LIEKEMKKIFYLLAFGMMLVSCEIETSGNGKLDGYWQMSQVDTLATGGVADTRESFIYWGVQGKLLQIRYSENDVYLSEGLLFRFEDNDSILTLSSPFVHHLYETDEPIDDVEILKPFGIYRLVEKFAIKELDDNNMVLTNDVLRLHFRRY
jgi:hypothetical protein